MKADPAAGAGPLIEALARHSEDAAILSGPVRVGKVEALALVEEVARALDRCQVPGRATVALADVASPLWPALALGILASGRVLLPLPLALVPRLSRLRPGWIVGGSPEWPEIGRIALPGGAAVLRRTCHPAREAELDDPDIGYLVASSGSTAEPKVIKGSLAGMLHFVQWQVQEFAFPPGLRFSQLTTPSFDPVYREIFTSWLSGGTIVVPADRAELAVPQRLARFLSEERIEVLHAVPTLLRCLERAGDGVDLPALRYVFSAGEPLFGKDVQALRRIAPNAEIVNLYGPSETTLAKFWHRCDDRIGPDDRVPVGKPLPGASAILLKPSGEVCGTGEPGEVHIRTRFRSRGYLRDPEQSAAAFVVNPFGASETDLLYRTGDVGSLLPSGDLLLIGRMDDRLKLRGLWVELSAVEAALRGIVDGDLCVDVLRPESGEPVLACFVAAAPVPVAALRRAAAARLPDHAIPVRWLFVDELPRTDTGKVDRLSLRAGAPAACAEGMAAPAGTSIEQRLMEIFRESIETAGEIDLDSDFFAIGGQSIEAARIIGLIEARLDARLPLRAVYEAGSVRLLARRIDAARDGSVPVPDVAEFAETRTPGPVQLSDAQVRFAALERAKPGNRSLIQVHAVRIRGPLRTDALRRACDDLVKEHDSLRLAIDVGNGTQSERPARTLPFVMIDCLGQCEAERTKRIVERTLRPFDLLAPPLMRADLYEIGAGDWLLVLSTHVIVSDGRSKQIWLQELSGRYAALVEGRPFAPREPGPSFLTFAARQAERRGAASEPHQRIWRERLAPALIATLLPYDRIPLAGRVNEAGETLKVEIPEALGAQLRKRAAELRKTVNVLLLAGMVAALRDWSGRSAGRTVVKVPHANRPAGFADVTGCFTESLVLAIDLAGAPAGLVELVDLAIESALACADLGFEGIADAAGLGPERYDPATFPIMFAPQPDFSAALDLLGVDCEPAPVDLRTSIFDLHLFLADERGQLQIKVNYSTTVFDRRTVNRFAAELVAALYDLAGTGDCHSRSANISSEA